MIIPFLRYILFFTLIWTYHCAKSQAPDTQPPVDYKPEAEKFRTIFRSTRLVNFQTVETLEKGSFDLRISHRLGDFKEPFYNFFGWDGPATIKIGFDYSITNNFTVGYGRNSSGKLWEFFLKYRILRQREDGKSPLSITALVSTNITSRPEAKTNEFKNFPARMCYVYQIMFARQFGKVLSFQIAPTWIHYNQVNASADKNDQFVLATMARLRLTRSFLLIGEYGYRFTKLTNPYGLSYHNSASFGIEWQTSGHSFQFFVVNSNSMNESQYLSMTTSNVLKGEIRLGFNISRVFHFGKRK